ncbi:MAG: DUF748 domain-containing protein [Porticoccaceae bacterium]
MWRLERARLNNIAAQLDLNGHQIPLNLDELNTGAIDSRQLHKGTPINLLLMAHEAELDLAIQVATLGDRFKINGAVSLHDFKIERWLPTAAAADITLPSSIKEAKGDIRLKTNMNISLNDSIPDIVLNNISVALSEVKLPALSEYLSVIIDADITTEEIQYRVNQLSLAGLTLNSKNIHLTESSTEPAADIRFSELTLTTDRFYLHQPEHGTHLILQTKLGEYGSLNINGRFSASNEPDKSRTLNTKGTVKVDQLDLVPFSGYAKRYLGRHIDSGALNLDIDTQIEADNINASVRIEAHQLYLGGEYHTTDSSILDELGMPLNTALSLLRDSDETITLTLPLKGDMDNPQLKIGSIVNKALLNATKSVLITQLGPLAVISAASKTLDFADSLKLKPILFAAASAEVGSTEQEKLDALKNLLIKRPSLKVTICGYAVTTDIMGREAQPQPEQLNEAQTREQALTLARQRGEIVKQTLVKEGVESKQLIACAGKIDKTANALPRVALSF